MNLNVSVIAPFFPSYAKQLYGPDVATDTVVGAIFCIYPLMNMFLSPVMGAISSPPKSQGQGNRNSACTKAANNARRITMLQCGLVLCMAGTLLFGCFDRAISVTPETNPWIPLGCKFVARAVQGTGAAAIVVSSFALNSANFPEKLGQVIAIQEVFGVMGFVLGPVVGGMLIYYATPENQRKPPTAAQEEEAGKHVYTPSTGAFAVPFVAVTAVIVCLLLFLVSIFGLAGAKLKAEARSARHLENIDNAGAPASGVALELHQVASGQTTSSDARTHQKSKRKLKAKPRTKIIQQEGVQIRVQIKDEPSFAETPSEAGSETTDSDSSSSSSSVCDASDEQNIESVKPSFCSVMTVAGPYCIPLVGCAPLFALCTFGFLEPVWALHLNQSLAFDERGAGLMFAVPAFSYGVTSYIAGVLVDDGDEPAGGEDMPKKTPLHKRIMNWGWFFLILGGLLIGPCPLYTTGSGEDDAKEENLAYVSQIGSALFMGASVGFLVNPSMPAMLIIAREKIKARYRKSRSKELQHAALDGLEDQCAGIFGFFLYAGEALGPLLGGSLSGLFPHTWVVNCTLDRVESLGENPDDACKSGFPWAATAFVAMCALFWVLFAWKVRLPKI